MQRATREKDPAAVTAEKLLHAFANDEPKPLLSALDPTVSFQSPMGVYYGRPYVKAWLEFEVELLRPYAHMVRHHATVAEDGLKVGRIEWSVGGLHFTDTVTQTQVLTIRSIKRHIRRDCKTQNDHDVTEALLLAWTGPHFSKYCAARGRGVDNRAIVLPVLDYSFMEMHNIRSLLIKEPLGGRVISDDNVVFHFLQEAIATDQQAAEAAKQADQQNAGENSKQTFGESSTTAGGKKGGANTITIQAKNRAGEVNAIIIDRSSLEGKAGDQSRLDMLEDSELQVRRDRNRYVCSGIRLSNNAFTQVKELDHVLRIFIVNAFYFVTLLDLSTNQLTEIPNLSQLMSLQTLYLHDNKIADWRQVEKLQSVPLLHTLTLFGNPLQQDAPSAKTYKFNVLFYFYSAQGYRSFSTRQQTLQHSAAVASATASRPASRVSNAGRCGTAGTSMDRGVLARSPSPMNRAPTPALATRGGGGGPSHAEAPAPTMVKIRLRQLDHCVISPLEVETLEQFIHVIKRRLKRASSPGAPTDGPSGAAAKAHGASGIAATRNKVPA